MTKGTKKILLFILLTFILNIYPYIKIINQGSLSASVSTVFILMWNPAIAAIITKFIFDRKISGLGWTFGKLKYLLISYLIPLISALIVYSIIWLLGLGDVDITLLDGNNNEVTYYMVMILILSTLGVLGSVLSALGEEIGWRGFLVSELNKKYSFVKISLISGVIWNIYHYPVLLFGGYNSGSSVFLSFIFFTITVFALSFIATYFRLLSGSLWTGVIIHASHNLFIQQIFDKITIDTGSTKIYSTEFGLGIALVYTLIAIYLYRNKDNLVY